MGEEKNIQENSERRKVRKSKRSEFNYFAGSSYSTNRDPKSDIRNPKIRN